MLPIDYFAAGVVFGLLFALLLAIIAFTGSSE